MKGPQTAGDPPAGSALGTAYRIARPWLFRMDAERAHGLTLAAADVLERIALLAPLAAARQAVIYQCFLDRIEPSERPYHQGDPVLWLRNAAVAARW